MTTQGCKILSLDGGGIRGYSMLLILQHLFWKLNTLRREDGLKDVHPYQYFDLIGGVSGGGTIALMLGRLRMSIQDTIHQYEKMGDRVFRDPKKLGHYMFDEHNLQRAVQRVVETFDRSGDKNAGLEDPLGDQGCRTVLYVLPFHNPNSIRPTSLRSYDSPQERASDLDIWEAASATSAVPKVFKPLTRRREHEQWVDAAMKFKNPSELLIDEIANVTRHDRSMHGVSPDHRVGVLVSLGTGKMAAADLSRKSRVDELLGLIGLDKPALEAVVRIATDAETVHSRLYERFRGSNPNAYHRFNVVSGLEHVMLFEREKMPQIKTFTKAYLEEPEVDREIWRAVEHMHRLMDHDPLPLGQRRRYQAPSSSSSREPSVAPPRLLVAHRPTQGIPILSPERRGTAPSNYSLSSSAPGRPWDFDSPSQSFYIAPAPYESPNGSPVPDRGRFLPAPGSAQSSFSSNLNHGSNRPPLGLGLDTQRQSAGYPPAFAASDIYVSTPTTPVQNATPLRKPRATSSVTNSPDLSRPSNQTDRSPTSSPLPPTPSARHASRLLRTSPASYWDALTPELMQCLITIFDDLLNRYGHGRSQKILPFTAIDNHFMTRGSSAETWMRLDPEHGRTSGAPCAVKTCYSKNLALAYMYMLVVENISHTQPAPSGLKRLPCGHSVLDSTTMATLSAFGNWAECPCSTSDNGLSCGRLWSFANGSGMWRWPTYSPWKKDGPCPLTEHLSPTGTPPAAAAGLEQKCRDQWHKLHPARPPRSARAKPEAQTVVRAEEGRPRRHTAGAADCPPLLILTPDSTASRTPDHVRTPDSAAAATRSLRRAGSIHMPALHNLPYRPALDVIRMPSMPSDDSGGLLKIMAQAATARGEFVTAAAGHAAEDVSARIRSAMPFGRGVDSRYDLG